MAEIMEPFYICDFIKNENTMPIGHHSNFIFFHDTKLKNSGSFFNTPRTLNEIRKIIKHLLVIFFFWDTTPRCFRADFWGNKVVDGGNNRAFL
jgi:hypothetical protein